LTTEGDKRYVVEFDTDCCQRLAPIRSGDDTPTKYVLLRYRRVASICHGTNTEETMRLGGQRLKADA